MVGIVEATKYWGEGCAALARIDSNLVFIKRTTAETCQRNWIDFVKIPASMNWERRLRRLGLTSHYQLSVLDDPSPQRPAVKSLERHPNRARQICMTLPTPDLRIWATSSTPSPSPS